jgi:organic radical activating enzyme
MMDGDSTGGDPLLDKIRARLNSVSPSFCLAKWKHATIHLANGTTHSCYLPPVHGIPISEIAQNPSALHNTSYKKLQRKDMLEGRRPKECSMCWAIEDLPQKHVSDRIMRGNESWTAPYFDEVKNAAWDADVMPAYLEVSFSSVCNFKCSYCSPHVSTKWHEEIKAHGPYKLNSTYQDTTELSRLGLMPNENENENPYIDAFWKWWPELSNNLKVFRVTGGEPLLSRHTFKILDWFEEHPNPNIELDINSNFGVPRGVFDRFLDRAESLVRGRKINRFKIHTSLDTVGKQAEYIRNGLDFERFRENVSTYLMRIPSGDISFMSTFNALSVVGYKGFLDWMLELRHQYQNNNRWVNFDTPHLTGPAHQSIRVLTPDYAERIHSLIGYMEPLVRSSSQEKLFSPMELEKMRRILDWMLVPQDQKMLRAQRQDFYLFFTEHDRRRGTDFLSTFPEMTEFWQLCRSSI